MTFINSMSKSKFKFIFFVFPIIASCSAAQVGSTSAGSVITANEDEKSLGEFVDDASIKIGIKDKFFMHKADLFNQVNVDVELGRVLLTGTVPNQDDRLTAVRLTWEQFGVKEVLNEIEISEKGFTVKKYAEDKWIHTQLLAKMLKDKNISSFKFNIEVKSKIIYLLGVTSDKDELDRLIDHARSIKGVNDIINYVQIRELS